MNGCAASLPGLSGWQLAGVMAVCSAILFGGLGWIWWDCSRHMASRKERRAR